MIVNCVYKDVQIGGNMRVITGSARGRRLKTLEGLDVRPTTEKVKEAVFSAIQFEVEGSRFLDLFAGSGQMGIEALSRGAHEAVFVDNTRNSIEVIKQNLQATELMQNAIVLNSDAYSFLNMTSQPFNIAYLDPPYNRGILDKILPLLATRMAKGGVILAETAIGEEIPETVGDFKITKTYRYGKIAVTVYRDK